MAQFTSRIGFHLPGGGMSGLIRPDEVSDIDRLNENFRRIDQALGAPPVISPVALPPSGFKGQLALTENDNRLQFFNGMQWRPHGNYYVGPKADREKMVPKYGDIWLDSDAEKREYIGSSEGTWRRRSGIIPFSAASWAYSAGSGLSFRGSRSATLNLPDAQIEERETVMVSSISVGSGYGYFDVSGVNKLDGKSATVQIRFTQFHNSTINGGDLLWRIIAN